MILEILNKVAETDSTKEKQNIIQSNSNNTTLKRLFLLTYSKQIMFGIKKFPEFTSADAYLTLDEAFDFLENKLAKRVVTGHAAIEKLTRVLDGLSVDDAEVIRRVIMRDLRIGAGATIANKVWKNLIPAQPQMLASPQSDKTLSKIKFPAFAQLKADGARCFAEVRGDTIDDVKLLSRAGNEYFGLDKLKEELIKATASAREVNPDGILIDGELVWFPTKTNQVETTIDFMFDDTDSVWFPSTATEAIVSSRTEGNGIANKSLKATISEEEAEDIKFQVWDFVPLSAYQGLKSAEYQVRFSELEESVKGFNRIILIENTLVKSLDEAKVVYQKYIEQGLEGIILKNIFGIWENKRSENQVKFKEVISFDLKIVGTYVHKKDPNKLGGVYFESECGRIKVKAGSGFKDTTHIKNESGEWIEIPMSERHELDREYLWSIRDSLIGKIIEGECNGWLSSKSRKEPYVSLFLPTIKKFRNDKMVANTFEDMFGLDFTEATGIK